MNGYLGVCSNLLTAREEGTHDIRLREEIHLVSTYHTFYLLYSNPNPARVDPSRKVDIDQDSISTLPLLSSSTVVSCNVGVCWKP